MHIQDNNRSNRVQAVRQHGDHIAAIATCATCQQTITASQGRAFTPDNRSVHINVGDCGRQ